MSKKLDAKAYLVLFFFFLFRFFSLQHRLSRANLFVFLLLPRAPPSLRLFLAILFIPAFSFFRAAVCTFIDPQILVSLTLSLAIYSLALSGQKSPYKNLDQGAIQQPSTPRGLLLLLILCACPR